jgi:L-aspartate oxidase
MAEAFPTVHGFCREAGLDPEHDLIPVAPAAHFHMGGVLTDAGGRTSVEGLWACGEVASTGAHGANRLASNSLLEAVVFGARVAEDLTGHAIGQYALMAPRLTRSPRPSTGRLTDGEVAELRTIMSADVGVERDRAGLASAEARLDRLGARLAAQGRTANLLIAAQLIARAALLREESRGAHFRSDFPDPDPAQAHRSYLKLSDLTTALADPGARRGAA